MAVRTNLGTSILAYITSVVFERILECRGIIIVTHVDVHGMFQNISFTNYLRLIVKFSSIAIVYIIAVVSMHIVTLPGNMRMLYYC